MTLSDVIGVVPAGTAVAALGPHGGETRVTQIAYDSRQVQAGAVFVALQGLKDDGTRYVPQAVARGAIAVVSEAPCPEGFSHAWIPTGDARLAIALLADRFYDSPSRRMPVIGVTGTNGKTTTGYLLASILDAAGMTAGLLGTVSYRIGREERGAARTTPESTDVQALLAEMIDYGCRSAVMEVSSHALALRRVDGMRFAAGVFTNLTRDHLDFHGDMEAYFAAKRRLFEMLDAEAPGVINMDDPRGSQLMAACPRHVTYGITQAADVMPTDLAMSLTGLRCTLQTPVGAIYVQSSLVGRPNVYNILAATATAVALGISPEAIARGIASLPGVPGRFEVVSSPEDDITVVVDYAHTDDALRNLLETARPLASQRLLTVFGCGGDRDRTKRPLMGMVATRLSDVVIITSDNPRSEEPGRIIEDIRRGITPDAKGQRHSEVTAIEDRAAAIARAVRMATAGDLVLVAGKGHEKTQHIGAEVLPFDDVAESRAALASRRARKGRAV
ncbi:MAG: UDP-N-acetylmuramoyl-L-alanyl-D-glutamate--2,6-diaminopimelate ligase [Acidobacteria bacterium]|nr:UDP-N-acetylmuramoyl-L-alanyl-D-glutamate--2,6-diaminopimelate ligase [Acidobacteriota bacterium]